MDYYDYCEQQGPKVGDRVWCYYCSDIDAEKGTIIELRDHYAKVEFDSGGIWDVMYDSIFYNLEECILHSEITQYEKEFVEYIRRTYLEE